MSMEEMFGDSDPTLDSAAMKIMALGAETMGGPVGAPQEREPPKRALRENRDPTEDENSGDLDKVEGERRAAETDDKPEKEAAAPEDEGDDFLEIPGAEGEEARRVPLSEAIEKIKQADAFNSDVKAAVIKAETEVLSRAEKAFEEIQGMHRSALVNAQATLRTLPIPQPPNPVLLDRNSPNYDPETYHVLQLQYQDSARRYNAVRESITTAEAQAKDAEAARDALTVQREDKNLAKYWPEWGDPKTRETTRDAIFSKLNKYWGIEDADVDKLTSHKLMLIAKEAIDAREAKGKDPEIKKAVQERVAKVTRGGATPPRQANGQFVNQARSTLKETGSEAAMANWLLKSGALR